MEKTQGRLNLTLSTVPGACRSLWGGFAGDMGARVIKVEPPSGDGYRNIPLFLPDHAKPHEEQGAERILVPVAAVNRNKRSVCGSEE